MEPWYRLAESTIRPSIELWFNWRIEGVENIPGEGPTLIAGNHTSYFDPLAHAMAALRAGRRPRFLYKSELRRNPFMRKLMDGAGQIPVYRGTGSRAPVDAAISALGRGETVVIFPEGSVTRNPDQMPMEGRTGVARIALEAGVPVIPSAQWGGHRIWQKGGQRGLTFGRPVWVRVGTPMEFPEFADRKDDPAVLRKVTDEVMARITSMVTELRAGYPARWESR